MKIKMLFSTIAVLQTCIFAAPEAEARHRHPAHHDYIDSDDEEEFDEPVYYSRRDVVRCRNTGRNVAIGAGIGVLTGLLLGRGRLNPAVPILGFTGGIIGGALSCREKEVYIEHVELGLSRPENQA